MRRIPPIRKPSFAKERSRAGALRTTAAIVGLVTLAGCKSCGCGKKESDDSPIAAPPPLGAASQRELTTGLGPARGLEEGLAATSTKWKRVFVLDDKRAILAGDVSTEAVALITEDAGRTWRSLRTEKEGFSNWNASTDGAMVFAVGARDGSKLATEGSVESVKLSFASGDATTLGPPTPLFTPAKGPLKGKVLSDAAIPAMLPGDYAGVVAEEAPRRPIVYYGGRPGVADVPAGRMPAGEQVVPVPFGRPPALLSVRGRDVFVRPFPAPNKPADKATKIVGVVGTPTLAAELSTAPACEFGEWSFQRVKQPGGKMALIGAGAGKGVGFLLPEKTSATTRIGCNGARVIVEIVDTVGKLNLSSCDFKGVCTTPQNAPFRPWPEQHDQEISSAPTDKGILSLLAMKAGARWGLYMAQSNDSSIFEQPRVVAEGTGDRGRLEAGALFPIGSRVILLLTADIMGSSRRGWYVTVTDDGGLTWNSP